MRIPDWTPELKAQPEALVQAITERRGGALINLDRALLWSEPLARGWNVYLKAVRTELPTSRKLRELGICTVALLTGAAYEYTTTRPTFWRPVARRPSWTRWQPPWPTTRARPSANLGWALLKSWWCSTPRR